MTTPDAEDVSNVIHDSASKNLEDEVSLSPTSELQLLACLVGYCCSSSSCHLSLEIPFFYLIVNMLFDRKREKEETHSKEEE